MNADKNRCLKQKISLSVFIGVHLWIIIVVFSHLYVLMCMTVTVPIGTKLSLSFNNLTTLTAVSLTVRDVNRTQLATTITRMDAGVEPPWTVSRRVVAGGARLMSLIHANKA